MAVLTALFICDWLGGSPTGGRGADAPSLLRDFLLTFCLCLYKSRLYLLRVIGCMQFYAETTDPETV